MGYETKTVANPGPESAIPASKLVKAPVPEDAPEFFVAAMQRARRLDRPVVIDFWATWCVPCKKLKKLTMENAGVAKVLSDVEVIYVDLDAHPTLAKAYSVTSIPDVFFVNVKGVVVDRLRDYEAVPAFLVRLKKLWAKGEVGTERLK